MRITVFILMLFCSGLQAQLTQILGPQTTGWSFFGESVAVSGEYMAVGQPARDAFFTVDEYVHIYKREMGEWGLIQSIKSQGIIAGESDMGARTAMTDRWLAFSQDMGSSWRIHMYERQQDTFLFRQTLSVPEPYSTYFHCKTIALSNEHMISGGKNGRAFFFRFQNDQWERIQIVTNNKESFGSAIALDGNTAIIGSELDSGIGVFKGAGYVYDFDGTHWSQTQKLYPSDASINHSFGTNVAIHKDILLITDFTGSYNTTADISAAYVFKKQDDGEWLEIQKLASPHGGTYSNFGKSIVLSDDFLFIGSDTQQKVFKYKRNDNSYGYIRSISGPNYFGESMAISGNKLVIGCPGYNNLRGAVYMAQVTENLLPVLACQFPIEIYGNLIDEDQIGDLFYTDTLNPLDEFGVITIDNFFQGNPDKGFCFNDSERTGLIDFTGISTLENPGLEISWELYNDEGDPEYEASDLLDNIKILKPTLINPLVHPAKFMVHFGPPGEESCVSYLVQVEFADFTCPDETIHIDIFAGDSIQLLPPCDINPLGVSPSLTWLGDYSTMGNHEEFAPWVFPIDTSIYRLYLDFNPGNIWCHSEAKFQVNTLKIDGDGDGFFNYEDCDDSNPAINPIAVDTVGNEIDEDCDGIDEDYCHLRKPASLKGEDVMVWEGKSSNYGNSPSLNIGTPGNLKRVLIHFKMESIPANAIIDSAYLTLHYNPEDSYSNTKTHWGYRDLLINRIIEPWQEDTVKWNTQPSASDENEVLIETDLTDNSATRGISDIDVTELIQDMIREDERFGLLLKMKEEDNNFRQLLFASSDHPDPNFHPELRMCWHVDNPDFSEEILNKNSTLDLCPNPATNSILIDNKGAETCLKIVSVSGEVLKKVNLLKGQNKIDLQSILPGMYFTLTDDGRKARFLKIFE